MTFSVAKPTGRALIAAVCAVIASLLLVQGAAAADPTVGPSHPSDGSLLASSTPLFDGSSSAVDGAVRILLDGSVHEVETDSAGDWEFQPSSPLAEGQHSYQLQAVVDGIAGPLSPPIGFSIDTTAPDPPVITRPENFSLVNVVRPRISFTTSPDATTRCATDSGPLFSCSSPYQTPTLADGAHSVTVVARDSAGNSAASAVQFTVDTTNPVVTLSGTPAEGSYINQTHAGFSFNVNEPADLECAFDSLNFAPCSSPELFDLSNLPDGLHRFSVRAVDLAGNYSLRRIRTWTVDTTAPVPPQVLQPGELATVTVKRPTIGGSSEPHATVTVSVDGLPDASATADWDGSWSARITPELGDGIHQFTATATDRAGNVSLPSSPMQLRIDAESPVASFQSRPGPVANRSSSTFNFTANEQSTFECRVDNSPFGACEAPVLVTGLADGTHTFFVRATDLSGHLSAAIAYSWLIDTTGPVIDVSQDTPAPSISPTFSFSSNEPGTTYKCRIDGSGAFTTCASPFHAPTLPAGAHRLELRATDPVGNTTQKSVPFEVLAPPVSSPSTPAQTAPEQPGTSTATTQCTGIDGALATPAAVSLSSARSSRTELRLTLSSDRRALVELAVKRGTRSIASGRGLFKAGRTAMRIRVKRSKLRSGGLVLSLKALTLEGARSSATAALSVSAAGAVKLGTSGTVIQSGAVCAAASSGRRVRVKVIRQPRQAASKGRIALSVKTPVWALLNVKVVQGDVVASEVVPVAPGRPRAVVLRPLKGRVFSPGRADVQISAAGVDGLWRTSTRRISLR
jgi:hypothetical protein